MWSRYVEVNSLQNLQLFPLFEKGSNLDLCNNRYTNPFLLQSCHLGYWKSQIAIASVYKDEESPLFIPELLSKFTFHPKTFFGPKRTLNFRKSSQPTWPRDIVMCTAPSLHPLKADQLIVPHNLKEQACQHESTMRFLRRAHRWWDAVDECDDNAKFDIRLSE